jgi:hypothetical protein
VCRASPSMPLPAGLSRLGAGCRRMPSVPPAMEAKTHGIEVARARALETIHATGPCLSAAWMDPTVDCRSCLVTRTPADWSLPASNRAESGLLPWISVRVAVCNQPDGLQETKSFYDPLKPG